MNLVDASMNLVDASMNLVDASMNSEGILTYSLAGMKFELFLDDI